MRESLTLIRGVLQVALAMLAVASVLGWLLLLGLVFGGRASQFTPLVALGILTLLYGLLGLAVGNAMTRRHGKGGLACAVLGTLLTWGLVELIFANLRDNPLGPTGLRVPLILAVPLAALGGVLGMSRIEDRRGAVRELEEEMAAMPGGEDETE